MSAGRFGYPAGGPFSREALPTDPANNHPLTPLTFLRRSAIAHPDRPAVIDGDLAYTWRETHARCVSLASALQDAGLRPGEVVSAVLSNIPAMYEAHYGVPMAGGILNAINVRLDEGTIEYILGHAEAKFLLCEDAFAPVVMEAVRKSGRDIRTVFVGPDASKLGQGYEDFIAGGDPGRSFPDPEDESMAISLNYTSGTTGRPKGVVYHYRGAHLLSLGNVLAWQLPRHARYLWTLPMFHCNGWCFPWTTAAVSGTSVCLRKVAPDAIAQSLRDHRPTHLCGAPIVLEMLLEALSSGEAGEGHEISFMVAAAPPPAATLQRAEELGVRVTHVYGLTECYGPAVVCEAKAEWDSLPPEERASKRSRQGLPYVGLEGLSVGADSREQHEEAPGDGIGEVLMRGNVVMLGYLKDPEATAKAFADGWFHTGDLGVMEDDDYVKLKDRSKDIIISGGENISSIEVENALHRHPAVAAAAVVAKSDPKWGETPCAFIELREGHEATREEIIRHCKEHLASYMCPRHVSFQEISRTSTGKVQKFKLREKAERL